MANNFAKNHLSNMANKGRFGDTELVHVNQQEKTMLEMAGGSGTINPNTGLKEYFPWLALASTAIGAIQANRAGAMQADTAASQSQAYSEGIKQANIALGQVDEVAEKRKDLALLQHDKKMSDLSFTTETSKADLQNQLNTLLKKSNLVTSGSAMEKESEQSRRISGSFTSGVEGLYSNLGETMADIEQFQEGEKTRLGLEKERLEREKSLVDKTSSSWYLGKNISNMFS